MQSLAETAVSGTAQRCPKRSISVVAGLSLLAAITMLVFAPSALANDETNTGIWGLDAHLTEPLWPTTPVGYELTTSTMKRP